MLYVKIPLNEENQKYEADKKIVTTKGIQWAVTLF